MRHGGIGRHANYKIPVTWPLAPWALWWSRHVTIRSPWMCVKTCHFSALGRIPTRVSRFCVVSLLHMRSLDFSIFFVTKMAIYLHRHFLDDLIWKKEKTNELWISPWETVLHNMYGNGPVVFYSSRLASSGCRTRQQSPEYMEMFPWGTQRSI